MSAYSNVKRTHRFYDYGTLNQGETIVCLLKYPFGTGELHATLGKQSSKSEVNGEMDAKQKCGAASGRACAWRSGSTRGFSLGWLCPATDCGLQL